MTTVPPPGSDDPAALADGVVRAALGVPGVTRMHPGAFGEVGVYLPGRRVDGVRLRADGTEVHLVVARGVDVMATARQVRSAVGAVVPGHVDVFVEDLADPEQS